MYPLLLGGALAAAVAQDMVQERRRRLRTLNVVDGTGRVIDQVDVLEEDFGAVAAWMGGRGPTAGLGLAPQLGGRFAHGLTEQQLRGLGFTFENPIAYGRVGGRARQLIRRIRGRGRGLGNRVQSSSSSPISQGPSAPSSFTERPKVSRQSRRDVMMGLRRDLEAAKSRGDFAEAAQINQELARIGGPR